MKDVKVTRHNRQVIIKSSQIKDIMKALDNTPWEALNVTRHEIKDTIILTFTKQATAAKAHNHLRRMFKLPAFVLNALVEKGKKEGEKRSQLTER